MDKPRERHLEEMRQMRIAIAKTQSVKARADLLKGLKRKQKELLIYDTTKNFKNQ